MRRKVVAALTATAVALAPATAYAQETPAPSGTGTQSSAEGEKGFDLESSSYIEFLSSTTEDATDNDHFNRFLAVLLDAAIGLGALIVVGGIYGEIAKLLPLK